MRRNIIYVLLFSLLSCACISCSENMNKNKFVSKIKDTSINGIYIPISKITINGNKEYFIIDTGANISMIDFEYYKNNQEKFTFLKDIDITINGISGDKDVSEKYVLAEIGDSLKLNQQFMTSDLSDIIHNIKNVCGFKIVGIIGSDYLNKYNFCVDFNNNALYINKAPLDSILKY